MKVLYSLLAIFFTTIYAANAARNVLVFGGNGFLGAATVEKLLKDGDSVTIVNRGNWYWDSKVKVKPHVKHIKCDRKEELKRGCPELLTYLSEVKFDKFDAVIDFSAFSEPDLKDSLSVLKDRSKLYVYISTDTIYDVCDPPTNETIKESSGVRPEDPDRRELLANHHVQANNKFKAEEALIKQRKDGKGVPYIIFRLPDVVGARDTTYRLWMYLLWVKVAPHLPHTPVNIPKFLKNIDNSFVYVEDVASMIKQVVHKSPQASEIVDQVYNLAWKDPVTIEFLLRTMEKHLGMNEQKFITDDDNSILYLYPMVRAGTLDVTKATETLHWSPTPFQQAMKDIVTFYENVMKSSEFTTQRDEIVQVGANQFYRDNKEEFYTVLEKLYNINLSHFRPHDEL